MASLEHDTQGAIAYNNFLKLYEDTYVLNYISGYSSSSTPYLKTFTIPTDGSSITEVDSLVTYTGSTYNLAERGILKIDNNTLFKSWGNATYSISSDGSLIEKVKSHGISYNTIHSSVLHVEGDIYALVAKDLIITLSISADGATATKVAELDYYPTLENYPTDGRLAPEFLKLNSNIYVVAYITRGGSYPNYRHDDHLELIEISADGQTITSVGEFKHCLLYTSPSPRDRG